MVQVIACCLLLTAMLQLLWGVERVGKAAERLTKSFREDHQMALCGGYAAMKSNLESAVATWRKKACAGDREMDVEGEIEAFLEDGHTDEIIDDDCLGSGPLLMTLHRESNPTLDIDYPNWVILHKGRDL